MNLKRWREADGTARLIRFIEAHHDHLWAHDQDALNAVFCGEFLELAPRWNFQTSMLWSEPDGLGLSYWEFRRLLADPEIGRAPSELQSLMRISYAVFCLQKKTNTL